MRTTTTQVLLSSLLAVASVACAPTTSTGSTSSTSPTEAEVLTLAPGWRWLIPPGAAPDSWPARWEHSGGPGQTSWSLEQKAGRLHVTLRYSHAELARAVDGTPDSIPGPKLRLTFDNADAFEFVRAKRPHYGDDGFVTKTYVYRGPAETISTVGLAVLDAEGRKLRSEAAAEVAVEDGIATISLPVLDAPLQFPEFETLDGDRVSADQLRGKIVVLDFWATWCSACIDAFPHLIALHEKLGAALGPDQVVFLGFNLDHDANTAKRVAARHELPWAQIHIPYDDATRSTWERVAGISGLPRVIVLDRAGTVRALKLDELDAVLEELSGAEPRTREEGVYHSSARAVDERAPSSPTSISR